ALLAVYFFFFQAEDGIRDSSVTGVQTCALPILRLRAAMCSVFSPVKEMTPADYRRVTEVTYLGYVHGTLAALKRMLPRNRGIIEIGRASCRERGYIWGGAGEVKEEEGSGTRRTW